MHVVPNDPERVLMARILEKLGGPLRAAVATSSVPEAFLAALVANESAGDPNAQRFEPSTFVSLARVLLGKKAAFSPAGIKHPLGGQDLLPIIDPAAFGGPVVLGGFVAQLKTLESLATSWGWTQIMGWHVIEFSKPLSTLTDRALHLKFAVVLLTQFANTYELDLGSEFEPLLRCWNTGRPDGETTDPNYVQNGLRRMHLYQEIAAAPAARVDG